MSGLLAFSVSASTRAVRRRIVEVGTVETVEAVDGDGEVGDIFVPAGMNEGE